jgi:hypothetical protein
MYSSNTWEIDAPRDITVHYSPQRPCTYPPSTSKRTTSPLVQPVSDAPGDRLSTRRHSFAISSIHEHIHLWDKALQISRGLKGTQPFMASRVLGITESAFIRHVALTREVREMGFPILYARSSSNIDKLAGTEVVLQAVWHLGPHVLELLVCAVPRPIMKKFLLPNPRRHVKDKYPSGSSTSNFPPKFRSSYVGLSCSRQGETNGLSYIYKERFCLQNDGDQRC